MVSIPWRLLASLLLILLALSACQEQAPDLNKKERDPRLIGLWVGSEAQGLGSARVEFRPDGVLLGGDYFPGGKRKKLFYTEGSRRLSVFVYGSGIKVSNWTHDFYYKVEGSRLFLWSSEQEMLSGQYGSADTFVREGR